MTTEAAAFLEAILASPADDAPRLVYADWLDEHGQSDRAEFIRVQCEIARLPAWDERRARLELRERVLVERHGHRWKAELPIFQGVIWREFRRGFVAHAQFDSFTTLKETAACWAATPVEAALVRWPRFSEKAEDTAPIPALRELTVTGTVVDMEDVGRLAASPLLATVRTLDVRHASLGPEGFRRLVASPHLKYLTALRAPFNSIGTGGVRTLKEIKTLPALAEIDLSETGSYGRYGEDPIVDVEGMEELASWPGLARVHTLTLSGNDPGRPGLRALLQSRHTTALNRLIFRGNALDGQAMLEFPAARPGLALDELDLGGNLLGPVGAGHLAKADCLRGLKVLTVDECELDAAAARKLTGALFLAEVRTLNLNYNSLGRDGLAALLGANPPHLHTLRLGSNDLDDAAAAELAGSPAADRLVSLDLGGNDLRDKGAVELARSARLNGLLSLQVANNHLSPAAVTELRRSPLGKRLAVLEAPGGTWVGGTEVPF